MLPIKRHNSYYTSYECSPCGRCVLAGEKDKKCIAPEDIMCESDVDCERHSGSSIFACNNGFCTSKCSKNQDCKRFGMGYYCDQNQSVCYRGCEKNEDCYVHGYQYECVFDQNDSDKSNSKIVSPRGECLPRIGGVDWGNENSPNFAAHSYEGIWGFAFFAAMTIKNVPFINVQDTVLKSFLLVKILQKNEDIEIYKKWCHLEFENFKDNDPEYEDIAKMIIPENYILNMPIAKILVNNPPALVKGNKFTTDKVNILFGARLNDPLNDPLPDKEHPENQYDDDRDSKPGVTVLLTGIISGEIYNVQRFWTKLNVNVLDADHLHGLIDFSNELSIIDTVPEILYYKPEIEKYFRPERSYFRAQRLKNTSSCKNVLDLSKNGYLKYEPFYNPDKSP